jgi:hypothetical protein
LETTPGGRIIDDWHDIKSYPWDTPDGPPPHGKRLWAAVSKEYAKGATGKVNTVQTIGKLTDITSLWHNVEKPIIQNGLLSGKVTDLKMYSVNESGVLETLSENEIDSLLLLKGDTLQ